jgi:hypothetical protein
VDFGFGHCGDAGFQGHPRAVQSAAASALGGFTEDWPVGKMTFKQPSESRLRRLSEAYNRGFEPPSFFGFFRLERRTRSMRRRRRVDAARAQRRRYADTKADWNSYAHAGGYCHADPNSGSSRQQRGVFARQQQSGDLVQFDQRLHIWNGSGERQLGVRQTRLDDRSLVADFCVFRHSVLCGRLRKR